MKLNKILLAVNNDFHSAEVAKAGFELAQKLKAEIAMVYAIEIIVPVADSFVPEQPAIDFYADQEEIANNTMHQFVELYGKGTMVNQFHPKGTPKEEIISTADDWGADLIVIGTHGRTGLGHLILGSVSEYVIRQSKIPVLVVPLKKEG